MHTPMMRDGDVFLVKVQAPLGSKIDYSFFITKKRDGSPAPFIWDGSYSTTSSPDGVIEVKAKVTVPEYEVSTDELRPILVTQEIRYHMAEAGEVFFVWGINGWQALPEANRPPGTLIKNKLMHTPMSLDGDIFVATMQVPAGSKLEYGFLITEKRNGWTIDEAWDGKNSYQVWATESGVIEIYSTLTLPQGWLDILWQWRWTLLFGSVLAGGFLWLRRLTRNPYLDF
jgi:hypothetical protein